MLAASVAAYDECYRTGMAVNWYSTSRVSALAAYDWIYNDLTPDERRAILLPLLRHVEATQPGPKRRPIYRIGSSGTHEGFYGEPNIVWFAGLAAYNDGVDDATAFDESKQQPLILLESDESFVQAISVDINKDGTQDQICALKKTSEPNIYLVPALQNPVTGSNNWASYETPFFLKKGEKPDLIKLNLVVKGPGKIWIKDVELLRAPLPKTK